VVVRTHDEQLVVAAGHGGVGTLQETQLDEIGISAIHDMHFFFVVVLFHQVREKMHDLLLPFAGLRGVQHQGLGIAQAHGICQITHEGGARRYGIGVPHAVPCCCAAAGLLVAPSAVVVVAGPSCLRRDEVHEAPLPLLHDLAQRRHAVHGHHKMLWQYAPFYAPQALQNALYDALIAGGRL
jgi:hypothetical protein